MTDALMYTDTNGDAHVVGVMSDNAKDIKYGNTNVEDALNTLNGRKVSAMSLVLAQNVATGAQVIQTYNSRKFSDYEFFDFYVGVLNGDVLSIRNQFTIAKSLWTSGKRSLTLLTLHGSASTTTSGYSVSATTFEYASDTSLNVALGASSGINAIEIVGYKMN